MRTRVTPALGVVIALALPGPVAMATISYQRPPLVSAGKGARAMCFVASEEHIGNAFVVGDGVGCPPRTPPLLSTPDGRLEIRVGEGTRGVEVEVVLDSTRRRTVVTRRLRPRQESSTTWSARSPRGPALSLDVTTVVEGGRFSWYLPFAVAAVPPRGHSRVVGEITYTGGPGPDATRTAPGTVVALDRRGRRVGRATAGPSGRFALLLRPGRYRLRARSGDARCRPRWATARRGRVVWAPVSCEVR